MPERIGTGIAEGRRILGAPDSDGIQHDENGPLHLMPPDRQPLKIGKGCGAEQDGDWMGTNPAA
jgi:hypothetical protein